MSGLSAHISLFSGPDKRIILKQSDQIVSRVPLPIFLDLIANPTLFCRLIKINCLHSRVQSLSNRHIPAPRVHLQSASKQMTRGEAGLRSPLLRLSLWRKCGIFIITSRLTLSLDDKNKHVTLQLKILHFIAWGVQLSSSVWFDVAMLTRLTCGYFTKLFWAWI